MSALSTASNWPRRLAALAALACLAGIVDVHAATRTPSSGDYAVARLQQRSTVYTAYAQVEPVATVPVRALVPGALRDLHVVPGSTVVRGEVLAQLGGSRLRAFMTGREAALHSAITNAATARQALAIARRQFAQRLATRQDVDAARSALASAQAAQATARTRLAEARDMQGLRAPVAGTVLAVHAGDGEQVTTGETVLVLLPANRLWVDATYYGADATRLHPGMRGRFQPADGSAAVPVKVVSVAAALAMDGGRTVGLLPLAATPPASWIDGQSGTVSVDGPPAQGVAIPTSALVLDRGRWWVVLHTSSGNTPRQVIPGPAQGWHTWIVSGLRPGQQVVSRNAFLEYHRDIAQSYQPPD
ncbi:efflux RND transporter periplasmic adaptor subunit [Dyella sp. A6]|uniref:efflux RND transporter periplasmic adaptor subunit n=1 Tax=Dyella aluminiiresistens TaxID=3069105 RepID=UPI002E797CE8|nr:efflux RND transporter periplasmic adaptor subunit [Dyella sp. A6]